MPSKDPQFHFALSPETKRGLNDAAFAIGLTSAAEYLRIAADYLVKHRTMPPEFVGMRAVKKIGPQHRVFG